MAKSNNNNNNGYLGVTEPISLSGPTEKDVVHTQEVEKVGVWISYASASFKFLVLSSVQHVLWCCAFDFHQCLADAGLYEIQEEAVSREEVLGKLDEVEHLSSVCFSWIIVCVRGVWN